MSKLPKHPTREQLDNWAGKQGHRPLVHPGRRRSWPPPARVGAAIFLFRHLPPFR